MRTLFLTGVLCTISFLARAQQPRDTVIVPLAKSSQVIFTIKDRQDLEILKHYNFQALFEDILIKLEQKHSAEAVPADTSQSEPAIADAEPESSDDRTDAGTPIDGHDEDDDNDDWELNIRKRNRLRTWQSWNFDVGTNNYLTDGKFPDSEDELHSVRPWGSWYFAGNSVQRTRLTRRFFLEWGVGVSWYSFKFQNDNILIEKDDNGIQFIEDPRELNFQKSKLSMSFVQASLVPVLDFGDYGRKRRFWNGHGNSFRIGIGPYVGYRISSHSKQVYDENGNEKEKNRDNFYLNNFRYGAKVQIGFRATDLFFNYDLNELFSEGKGPKLNAFSFGFIF